MLKGKKKGQMKGNKKGGKRPRESAETPPPSSSPPPPPPPYLIPSFEERATARKLIHAASSECPPELNMRFRITLAGFVSRGIIPNSINRLKTDESFKQSWDAGSTRPISHEKLIAIARDPSKKEEVERYLNSAEKTNYFDVPDPKERPDEFLSRGFFVIYPEGQAQKDPIFQRKPKFIKFAPLISKLGVSAVLCHNFMTGSDLEFSKVKKANLFCQNAFQNYFITLEVTDKLSGKEVTCQSKVVCIVAYDEMWHPELKEDLLPIEDSFVESFHRVED